MGQKEHEKHNDRIKLINSKIELDKGQLPYKMDTAVSIIDGFIKSQQYPNDEKIPISSCIYYLKQLKQPPPPQALYTLLQYKHRRKHIQQRLLYY